MDLKVESGSPARFSGQILFLPIFDPVVEPGGPRKPGIPTLPWRDIEKSVGRLLRMRAAEEGFGAKLEQGFSFHTQRKLRATRVVLLGLGNETRCRNETLRLVAGRAAKWAQRLRATEVAFALPASRNDEEAVRAVVEGFELGAYRFDRYRTTIAPEDRPLPIRTLSLYPGEATDVAHLQKAARDGRRIAQATNWARDLVNEPAGVMTPSRLAEEARAAAAAGGLQITVGGLKEIRALKMGMFLGVAQGSAEEPKLIHLWYQPKKESDAQKPPLALVGKAITFDSGGLSLKTADGMVDMKTDMAGSAAVLGAMKVIAQLKPPFPVHAFIGSCENMPSGTAYRPGDILISRLGKTVEINNTDAEGRLVLGDILTWANEHKPAALIDLATLTGACIVALDHYTAGVFGEDDALMAEVQAAARGAGEEMWRLPLGEAQRETLRSEVADMKNTGERYGSAISAAMFLKEFVGSTPWVHLDIAGPSQSPRERGYQLKGATGYGVRTLVEWVRRRSMTL